MNISYMEFIKAELDGIYGAEVLRDLNGTIELYDIYEGKGQDWETPAGLDYKPTKKKANYIKKLIKDEARFLFGKPPEFKLVSASASKENLEKLNKYLKQMLADNSFSEKLIKAARDCFIGRRVAVKLTGGHGSSLRLSFRPALEFVYEPQDDDTDALKHIVFFYGLNDKLDKKEQRIFKQKFELVKGRCLLNEGIYNGYGEVVENRLENFDTGLSFIPARVIINDGLSGDLQGESDVLELWDIQDVHNHLSSDDVDALRFNMFPQTVATDVSRDSLEKIEIAPSALIDAQTDETVAGDGRQGKLEKLESSFTYGTPLENTLNRSKNEMYELLSVPNISPNDIKGYITSGKSMKALYWGLITRCEEKYTTWRPALEWLARAVLNMAAAYGLIDVPIPNDLRIQVENIYPLMEDEAEEKALDMQAVNAQVMSRKSFMCKWYPDFDEDKAKEELLQIQKESQMFEGNYEGSFGGSEGGA